jgi:hypothetical protein
MAAFDEHRPGSRVRGPLAGGQLLFTGGNRREPVEHLCFTEVWSDKESTRKKVLYELPDPVP